MSKLFLKKPWQARRDLRGNVGILATGHLSAMILRHPSLIAYWPLTEESGTDADDVSANNYNGTYTGPTLAAAPGPFGAVSPSLDGVNDFINFNAALPGLSSSNLFSMMIWTKFTAAQIAAATNMGIMEIAVDQNNRIFIVKNNVGTLNVTARIGGTLYNTTPLSTPSADVWECHTVTVKTDATPFRIRHYKNGILVGSIGTMVAGIGTPDTLTSGKREPFGDNFLNGLLAHAAIFNVELTAEEVMALGRP